MRNIVCEGQGGRARLEQNERPTCGQLVLLVDAPTRTNAY